MAAACRSSHCARVCQAQAAVTKSRWGRRRCISGVIDGVASGCAHAPPRLAQDKATGQFQLNTEAMGCRYHQFSRQEVFQCFHKRTDNAGIVMIGAFLPHHMYETDARWAPHCYYIQIWFDWKFAALCHMH